MSRRSEYYLGARKKYYPVGSDCVLYHAYWDGTAVDHSTYGNDGTVVGGTFVENGIDLDGTDDYVNVPYDSSIQMGTGDFTIYAWFYRDTSAEVALVGFSGDTPSWYGWVFGSDAGLGGNLEATVSTYDSGYFYRSYPERYPGTPSAEMATGAWQFIVFCIDRDVGTKIWSSPYGAYSTNKGSTNSIDYQFGGGVPPNNGMFIGKCSANLVGNNWWNGRIGEMLWFNAVKSATDVSDFFNATKARYGL